jgi:hypothetical protein
MHRLVTGAILLLANVFTAPIAQASACDGLGLTLAVVKETDHVYSAQKLPDTRAGAIIGFAAAGTINLSLELNEPLGGDAPTDPGALRLARIAALGHAGGLILLRSGAPALLVLGKSPGVIGNAAQAHQGTALAGTPTNLAEAESMVLRALGFGGVVVGTNGGDVVVDAPSAFLHDGAQSIVLANTAGRLAVGNDKRGAAWLALKDKQGKRGRFHVLFGGNVVCGAKVVFAP